MRIVFIGTGDIGLPTLRALLKSEHEVVGVVTQPDKPVGRAQVIEPPQIKKALMSGALTTSLARTERALPLRVLQPVRIKGRQAIEEIHALTPDVIVVMAYGQILPRDILEIPKIACLNLHASLLPRWRGAAPIQAAIAAGDRETGITVMYMDEGLDTGDILLPRAIDIAPAETGGSLHNRLAEVAPEALLESLELLAKGSAPRIPQDNALATYAPKLKRQDGKIDWSEPAEVIERKIRAFDPWPGAFTLVTDKGGRQLRMKILDAGIVDLNGRPGEILRKHSNELIVGTGEKALAVWHVQLEGKWRMSASDFIRGHARLLERKLK
jgi:methionyl-tRNA formyltransferase